MPCASNAVYAVYGCIYLYLMFPPQVPKGGKCTWMASMAIAPKMWWLIMPWHSLRMARWVADVAAILLTSDSDDVRWRSSQHLQRCVFFFRIEESVLTIVHFFSDCDRCDLDCPAGVFFLCHLQSFHQWFLGDFLSHPFGGQGAEAKVLDHHELLGRELWWEGNHAPFAPRLRGLSDRLVFFFNRWNPSLKLTALESR